MCGQFQRIIVHDIKKLNQILTQIIEAHLKTYVTNQVKKNRSSRSRNDSIYNEKGLSKNHKTLKPYSSRKNS